MALRNGDDREIWNRNNNGKNRIGQAASGRSGLFDLRESKDHYSRNNETAPGRGGSEEETSGDIRNIQDNKKPQERPYRERHRVEVGGERKKNTQQSTGELKEWSFPKSTFQKSDAHRQNRVIRGNVPGNRRRPFPEKTEETARTESPFSTDLLLSKGPTNKTGRQSSRYGSGASDKLPEFRSDLRDRPVAAPARGTQERKSPVRGTSERTASVRGSQERKGPARGRSQRENPDLIETGRDTYGYRDSGRDLAYQAYPAPEEKTGEREMSSFSRKRKREQARKARERQIRKFYLMAGSGIILVIVLAVFVLVSLIRSGDKNGAAVSDQKTEAAASGQEGDGMHPETEDPESADIQTPGPESAGQENPEQEEKMTEPAEGTENTGDVSADSGQGDVVGDSEGEQIPEESSADAIQQTDGGQRKYAHQDDWRLLIVNPWNKIPEGYSVQTTSLINGESVDSRCYNELMSMLEACRAGNGTPIVCSSYRPHEKQVMLYENQVSSLISQGMSREEALKEAGTVVAVPGTSEHELGLAVDICDTNNQLLDESQAETWTQKWLMEHCWEYGFILRYPPEKTEFTGIIYEPWHYRYVGKEAAAQIHQQNICLEEYLSQ